MSDDNNDSFWKYVLAAGVSVGAWELWKRHQANNPDALEADAFKVLQQDFNPFSSQDLNKQLKAAGKLAEAKLLREHQEMERQGYPIDKKMEAATLEMLRLNNSLSGGSMDQFLDASAQVFQQAKQTAKEFGHSDFPGQARCNRCSDQGYMICSACHGIGTNRSVPYPQMTGNQVVDALIVQRYHFDSLCPTCRGAGKVICSDCSRGF